MHQPGLKRLLATRAGSAGAASASRNATGATLATKAEHVTNCSYNGLGGMEDVTRLGEHVAKRLEADTTNHAVKFTTSNQASAGSINDILLRQNALDDAAGATDGLKEAAVHRDDV